MTSMSRPGRRTVLQIGAAAAALLRIGGSKAAAAAVEPPIAQTKYGKVRGAMVGSVYAFKGVRYGADTAAYRFQPPRPPEPWADVRDATAYGAVAPQSNPAPPPLGSRSPIILTQLPPPPPPPPGAPAPSRPVESEDCLFLNVWTAGLNDGAKRPVIVWLHAGYFASGSGASGDGSQLAARGDVVVVSVNHRLNVFGFSHLADGGGPELAQSGNAGMLDVIAALEWIRDNIEAFGGDPGRVTLMGESGGGMKVAFLMASPRAKGLFHRAIVQSGPGLKMLDRDKANEVTDHLLREVGLDRSRIGDLATMPASKLLAASFPTAAKMGAGDFADLLAFAPVIDPELLPHHPFSPVASPLCADIPLLIGWNQFDMVFFMGADDAAFALDKAGLEVRFSSFARPAADKALAAYRSAYPTALPSDLYQIAWSDYSIGLPTLVEADRKVAQRRAAAFVYRFDWQSPALGGKLKSLHSLEAPFVFASTDQARALTGGGAEAKLLSHKMSTAWVSFAATGNPNSASGLPRWPRYDRRRAVMLLDTVPRVVFDPIGYARRTLSIT